MLCSKQDKLIAVGLIALGLSLGTFAIDSYNSSLQFLFGMLRGLMLMATAALLFGIRKKDKQHKDKFLLFWLLTVAFFIATLCHFCVEYFSSYMFNYHFFLWLLYMSIKCAGTALVGYLWYYVYVEYAELTQSDTVSTVPATQQINAVWETKEQPPAYVHPTSEDLSVSVQN